MAALTTETACRQEIEVDPFGRVPAEPRLRAKRSPVSRKDFTHHGQVGDNPPLDLSAGEGGVPVTGPSPEPAGIDVDPGLRIEVEGERDDEAPVSSLSLRRLQPAVARMPTPSPRSGSRSFHFKAGAMTVSATPPLQLCVADPPISSIGSLTLVHAGLELSSPPLSS